MENLIENSDFVEGDGWVAKDWKPGIDGPASIHIQTPGTFDGTIDAVHIRRVITIFGRHFYLPVIFPGNWRKGRTYRIWYDVKM